MTKTATETRSVVVEREMPHPPEKIWRALTQPHLIEEWLMKNDFKPVVGHRFNLRGDWGGVLDCEVLAVEPNKDAVLHLEFCARRCGLQSEERGDLYAHPDEHGDPPAHGAVGLPAGSEAGLRRRQGRMAAVLCEAGAGPGADGLKSAASRFSSSSKEVPLNWNKWIRQIHRWLSIAFTVAVIVNFVAMGQEEPAVWVGLLAAAPALPAAAHRSVHVRAAVCHQVAQRRRTGGQE